jgi:membrane protein
MEGTAQTQAASPQVLPDKPAPKPAASPEAEQSAFAQMQVLLRELPKHRASTLVTYVVRRFSRDSCASVASALSYTSLLAMVPVMAIGLAIFAAFPGFAGIRDQMIRVVLENTAPSIAIMVEEHLQGFIRNTTETTIVGVVGMAVTAILLINTIQSAFDRIWGGGRGFLLRRFPVYWLLITAGPIIFALAFAGSAYAFAMARSTGFYGVSDALRILSYVLPFLLEAVGFWLFYWLIPTKPVRWMDAAIGAIVAAILFEILKRAFGIYLGFLGSYQTLYGALAALPIFLIWMYLAWLTVLFGAEVAASLPEWRSGRRDPDDRPKRGDVLGLALGVLAVLRAAQSAPVGGEKFANISRDLGAEAGKLTQVMEALRGARFIVRTDANRWVLARDLSQVQLADLVGALQLGLGDASDAPRQIADLMTGLAKAERGMLKRTVEDALRAKNWVDAPTTGAAA